MMLHDRFVGNAATRYGQENEAVALAEYVEFHHQNGNQIFVEASGLVVSIDFALWPVLLMASCLWQRAQIKGWLK